MKTHNVMVSAEYHITLQGIKAPTAEAAAKKADAMLDYHLFANHANAAGRLLKLEQGVSFGDFTFSEGVLLGAVVDTFVKEEQVESYFGLNLAKYEDSLSPSELVSKFSNELLDAFETLGGIAESHGSGVLVQLIYLQKAIAEDGKLDEASTDALALKDIVEKLPSGAKWKTYFK